MASKAPTAGPTFTGVTTIAAGTAAAPSLTFTGATSDTGLYSPGTDEVAISTGGTERLFVDASGIVGQGPFFANRYAAVPSFNLRRAQGTQSAPTVVEAGGYICGLLSGNAYDGSAYQSLGGIRFVSDGAISNTSSPGYITFSTTPSGSTVNTERLRITSDGLLGLGTSAPGALLHLRSSAARMFCENSSTGETAEFGVDSTGALITAGGAKSAVFYTNGTERFRCDSSGRLLVGTSSTSNAGARLVIQANSGDSTAGGNIHLARGTSSPADGVPLGNLVFTDSNHTNAAVISANRDGGTWTSSTSQPTRLVFSTTADGASSPTERMRITNAGRIGIGTATPNELLEVYGNTLLYSSVSGYSYYLINSNYGIGTPNSSGLQIFTQDGDTLRFGHKNGATFTERARIDSSGRLLVGTSSDSGGALLQVNGDRIRVGTAKTPASATATGTTGEICWDASYVYICTATNTWKRAALSTW